MRKKWLYLAVTLFAALTLLVAGCERAPMEVKPIKLGSGMSSTGIFARMLEPFKAGARMAVEDINAGGGIRYGGTLHPLVWINYDSKSDIATCVQNVNKLAFEDEIDFLLNFDATSSESLAGQEITEPLKIPVLTTGFSKELLGPEKRYTFRNTLTSYEYTFGMLKWLSQAHPELKKIALIEKDYVSGREHVEYLEEAASLYGFEIVFQDFYAEGTTDFYPLITRALAANPDIVDHGISMPAEIAGIITQLRELGYEGMVVGSGTDTTPSTIAGMVGADIAEGYAAQGIDWSSDIVPPGAQEFYNRAMEWFGECTLKTINLYDTVMIMKQAIEAIDSIDPDEFVDWLENNPVETIFGELSYGGEEIYGINHQLLYPITIVQIMNGEETQVFFEPFVYE